MYLLSAGQVLFGIRVLQHVISVTKPGRRESRSKKWHADTNPFVNASVTNSSFDSALEEAVAIDPEEYWGFTRFAEGGGVEGQLPVAETQSGVEG